MIQFLLINCLINCLIVAGSSPPEPMVEDDDDGAELEEEELESVQVSETEFNFLDFVKR